jgi:hypothetical protein
MLENSSKDFAWPWGSDQTAATLWKRWWNNTKTVTGQTSSEMFLWYIVARCRVEVDKILANKTHLTKNLSLSFRNSTDEVLDIACAQLRFEDVNTGEPRLLPDAKALSSDYFPEFQRWWIAVRNKCASQVQVGRHRAVAMLIPGITERFGSPTNVTDDQWGWIGKFVSGSRATASELGVDFPESKGRWTGTRGQRAQLDAYFNVAAEIAKK